MLLTCHWHFQLRRQIINDRHCKFLPLGIMRFKHLPDTLTNGSIIKALIHVQYLIVVSKAQSTHVFVLVGLMGQLRLGKLQVHNTTKKMP